MRPIHARKKYCSHRCSAGFCQLLPGRCRLEGPHAKRCVAGKNVVAKIIEKSCQQAQVEAELRKREYTLLRPKHADHHARMRQYQCEVERGVREVPAKNSAKTGPDSLLEDATVKKSILDRNLKKTATGFLSIALRASTTPIECSIGCLSAPFIIPVVGFTAVMLNTGNVMF